MSDLMLFGVLRMPYETAMSGEISRRQFYGRAQEAADRIELLEAEVEKLRTELAAGAAREGGNTNQVGCERDDGLLNIHAESETCEVCSAPAAGTEKDAERYRWLRAKSPDAICAIAWSVPAACHFGEPDAAIDAAIAHTKAREGA